MYNKGNRFKVEDFVIRLETNDDPSEFIIHSVHEISKSRYKYSLAVASALPLDHQKILIRDYLEEELRPAPSTINLDLLNNI